MVQNCIKYERVIFNLSYGVVTRTDGWFIFASNMERIIFYLSNGDVSSTG